MPWPSSRATSRARASAWAVSSAGRMPSSRQQSLKRGQGLVVGRGPDVEPAGVPQVRQLGPDAGVVEAGAHRVRLGHLAVVGLEHRAGAPVEHAEPARGERRAVLPGAEPLAAGLDGHQADRAGSAEEGGEGAHGVGAAADAGDDRVRQPAQALGPLRARLVADDPLQVAHQARDTGAARRRCR